MKGFAVYDFPFGVLCVGYEDECITSFDTIDEAPPGGQRTPLTDRAFAEVQAYLSGARRTFSFPYRLEGTAFEKSVWQALLRIPYGETRTYGDIAAAIGSPQGLPRESSHPRRALPSRRRRGRPPRRLRRRARDEGNALGLGAGA